MKTSSCKAKGRNLQKYVVDYILQLFPALTSRDVISTSMGKSGVDVQLSEAAIKLFPYAIECKNQESLSLWACWKQTEDNARKEKLNPLLIVKRNGISPLVILNIEDFMRLYEAKI